MPRDIPPALYRDAPEHALHSPVVVTDYPAQNGTSGVLAGGKHARRGAAWATPRTGDQG